ncbi:MAG: class I SAM-dependent methyltransferase [Candidatus Eremiobacteraeota bacterium]|nr:class I SAM-dependent methyltransferase [Candidatus Eremiobacteraeota bacterium]
MTSIGRLRTPSTQTPPRAQAPYPLGYSDAEAERLGRQAARLNSVTERFFRAAGVQSGHRVLEIGSGLGHVSTLVASIVGDSGEVVGIERDAQSIAKAEHYIRAAGLHNVRFLQGDIHELALDDQFDALLGRFILMFLPDPAAALRSLTPYVRPGGTVVFHEISWTPFLAMAQRLPLWSALVRITHEGFRKSHADMDMGLGLHRTFVDAGLPAPTMRLEMMLGVDEALTQWVYELFQTVQPKIAEHGVDTSALGDIHSLYARLRDEVKDSDSIISSGGLVGAWTQKP